MGDFQGGLSFKVQLKSMARFRYVLYVYLDATFIPNSQFSQKLMLSIVAIYNLSTFIVRKYGKYVG